MREKTSRRSILKKGAMATAASVGVTAFSGSAAAASDWTIDISLTSGNDFATYQVKVPYGSDDWGVSGTDYNEGDDDLIPDDEDQEIILDGNVDEANNGFDKWTTTNTPEPYVTDGSGCDIAIY